MNESTRTGEKGRRSGVSVKVEIGGVVKEKKE